MSSRFLFLATNEWVPWGGSEELWGQAAERLARAGADVRASVKDWDRPVKEVDQLRAAGCRICYRQPVSKASTAFHRLLRLPDYVSSHLRSAIEGVDLIVISHSFFAESLPWIIAARSSGVPYAIIVQGACELWWPSDKVMEQMAPGFGDASCIYFVSDGNLKLFRRQLGLPLPNGKVVRNPFNVHYDARAQWPADSSGRLSLACVARLDITQKGHDLLLEVLSLERWRTRDVRVAFVGSGPNERTLRHLAEISKLRNVEFVGFKEDIQAVWSNYHALVLPSRFEGMPLALVEAMLCGRAAVVTDVAGNCELVRDGINGFVAKAPIAELVDEAMNRAWENRGRLREMGEQAAVDVRKLVSPDPVGDFVSNLTSLAASQ